MAWLLTVVGVLLVLMVVLAVVVMPDVLRYRRMRRM